MGELFELIILSTFFNEVFHSFVESFSLRGTGSIESYCDGCDSYFSTLFCCDVCDHVDFCSASSDLTSDVFSGHIMTDEFSFCFVIVDFLYFQEYFYVVFGEVVD